jgi:hypothetical protein
VAAVAQVPREEPVARQNDNPANEPSVVQDVPQLPAQEVKKRRFYFFDNV